LFFVRELNGEGKSGFDPDAIRQNAIAQGVDLSTITIVYENLTPDERNVLEQLGLITHTNETLTMAKFTKEGEILFKEKAQSVLYLGAD
jgi:hypothetical protein